MTQNELIEKLIVAEHLMKKMFKKNKILEEELKKFK